MYHRTYDGWGYSPLAQITTENVGRLRPIGTLSTVQSGWGVDAARMQERLNGARPWEFPEVPQGGSIWYSPWISASARRGRSGKGE